MAGSFYGLSIRDNSREIGKTDFNVGDLTAISLAGALTQMGALTTAIEGITTGIVADSRWGDNDKVSNAVPASPLSQRGVKWTVQGEDDSTHQLFNNFIPTADLSLLASGIEELDLTAGAGLAFKNAYNALVYSPAGNTATLVRVYYSD